MKGMKGFPINPERLQWCLRHYCLTLEDLARRAGLRPAALRRACGAGPGLTALQTRALTRVFEFNLGFFMEEDGISKEKLRVPQFRAAAGQPRRTTEMMMLLARVERHRGYFVDLFGDFPGWQRRRVSYPKLPAGDDYAAKARAVRRWLKFSGGAGFAELRGKVEAKGVLVFVGVGGSWQAPKDGRGREQFKGFALRHEVLPIIFVAKERGERNQSFTLLHELAHLIMHQKDAIDGERSLASCHGASRSRREVEANALASHVLLPAGALRAVDAKGLAEMAPAAIDEALQGVCDRHCVSAMVALARLRASRLVPAAVVDGYFRWSVQASRRQSGGNAVAEDRVAEVREIFGDRYVDRVLALEDERDITAKWVLRYLDTDTDVYDVMRGREWH